MRRNLFLFLLFLCPIVVLSQNFEVAGKAKVKVMDTDNTAEYIVVKQADGTLAVRDLSTIATDGSNSANEIQDLTLVGNTLQITKNGTATSIDLSQYLDDTKLSENEVDGFVANNGYLTVHIDSLGVAALGYVAGPRTVDTKLDSVGVAALGYVAGSKTVDTKLDSVGVAALGYVAGSHTVDTNLDSVGVAALGYVAGSKTVDTKLDSVGVAALGYVAGSHTVDTKLDSVGVAALGYVAGSKTVDTKLDSAGVAALGYVAGTKTLTEILTESADAGNKKITNLANPIDSRDAATKAYVDSLMLEFEIKLSTKIQDVDGNVYNTTKIGDQRWMAENLRTTKYNDGTPISSGYWYYIDDSSKYSVPYGALYNYYVVADTNSLNVCPEGWHVPTDTEWTTLTTYLGGADVAGGKMKETGTFYWNSPNTGSTNESGFAGLPGGHRLTSGTFDDIGSLGIWWSSTEYNTTDAWFRLLYYVNDDVNRDDTLNKGFGFSVRCLRD